MIAAFIWWYVSLEKQNSEIATVKFQSIRLNDPALYEKVKALKHLRQEKQNNIFTKASLFFFIFIRSDLCIQVVIKATTIFESTTKFHDGGNA